MNKKPARRWDQCRETEKEARSRAAGRTSFGLAFAPPLASCFALRISIARIFIMDRFAAVFAAMVARTRADLNAGDAWDADIGAGRGCRPVAGDGGAGLGILRHCGRDPEDRTRRDGQFADRFHLGLLSACGRSSCGPSGKERPPPNRVP